MTQQERRPSGGRSCLPAGQERAALGYGDISSGHCPSPGDAGPQRVPLSPGSWRGHAVGWGGLVPNLSVPLESPIPEASDPPVGECHQQQQLCQGAT